MSDTLNSFHKFCKNNLLPNYYYSAHFRIVTALLILSSPTVYANIESLCSILATLWVKHRPGDSSSGEHGGSDIGNRNRWIHTLPILVKFCGRNQTDCRVDKPGWCHPHLPKAGHSWVSIQLNSVTSSQ